MNPEFQLVRNLEYRRLSLDYTICFYCGLRADSVDHVPPKSAEVTINASRELVPSCRECNSILGARLPWTKYGRRSLIKRLLRRRYKQYLYPPKWSESEANDLGPMLRSTINSHGMNHEILMARLSYRVYGFTPPKMRPKRSKSRPVSIKTSGTVVIIAARGPVMEPKKLAVIKPINPPVLLLPWLPQLPIPKKQKPIMVFKPKPIPKPKFVYQPHIKTIRPKAWCAAAELTILEALNMAPETAEVST